MWISKDEVSSLSGSLCSLPMHINVQRYNCLPVYVLLSVLLEGIVTFMSKVVLLVWPVSFFFLCYVQQNLCCGQLYPATPG